jgi:transcriptional regulator with XRE-family HTH domain
VPEVRSPTVRRRELGVLLRALRNEKGLTVEQVAERLLCSPSKVSRMETGHGIATPRDIRDLCDLYDVTNPAERDRMNRLALEGKREGWWESYDLDFDTYVGLETDATGLKYYQSTIVPGLLQTADYARAMLDVSIPKLDSDRIDQLLEVKLIRQRVLSRELPLRLWAVFDEAALHRVVGGRGVMAAQLDRLVEVSANPNVRMQVIPYEAGAHPAMDSSFNILDLYGAVPNVVYVEGLSGWRYFERPADIARYQEVFDRLCHLALSEEKSIELIAKAGANYKLARRRDAPLDSRVPCPSDTRAQNTRKFRLAGRWRSYA